MPRLATPTPGNSSAHSAPSVIESPIMTTAARALKVSKKDAFSRQYDVGEVAPVTVGHGALCATK